MRLALARALFSKPDLLLLDGLLNLIHSKARLNISNICSSLIKPSLFSLLPYT